MLDNLSTPQKLGGLLVLVVILYVVYTSKTKAENELVIEDVVVDNVNGVVVTQPAPQQTITMNVEPEKEIYVTDIKLTGYDVQFAEVELYDNTAVNIIKSIVPTTSSHTHAGLPAVNLTDGNTLNLAHRGSVPGPYWFNIKLNTPTKLKDLTKVKVYSRRGSINKNRGNNSKIQLLNNGEVVLQNEWNYIPDPATPGQTIREYAVKQ